MKGSASRVATHWVESRVNPRIQGAIEESLSNLPDKVRWEVDDFLAGVLLGRAPSLERYASALYKAFAPLRSALGSKVVMYRGQPVNPPKISRKFLSWSTDPRIASVFVGKGDQLLKATIDVKDVIAGFTSENNSAYIEYLVVDKPKYQSASDKQIPEINWLEMDDEGWMTFHGWEQWFQSAKKAIAKAGGKILQIDKPDFYDLDPGDGKIIVVSDIVPRVRFVAPAGTKIPGYGEDEIGIPRPAPEYYGKVALADRKAKSRVLVEKRPRSTKIYIPHPDPEMFEIGYVLLERAGPNRWKNERCAEDIKTMLRGLPGASIHHVVDSHLDQDYRGQGLGRAMYERALRVLDPAIIFPDNCVSGTTTPEAMRVWKSLTRDYPSSGDVVASRSQNRTAAVHDPESWNYDLEPGTLLQTAIDRKPIEITPKAIGQAVKKPQRKLTPEDEKQIGDLMKLLGW